MYSELQGKGKTGQYLSEEDEFEFPKLIPIRASTAPPRPLTEIEEFRRSSDFLLLENTVMMSDHLKQRVDEKYDLDSEDGQRACKRFLNQIERLCERFKALCATRKYREQFSKAYKVLYKDGLSFEEAKVAIQKMVQESSADAATAQKLTEFHDFIAASTRGIIR